MKSGLSRLPIAVYVPHIIVKITALPTNVLFRRSFLYIAIPSLFFDYLTNATDDGGCCGLSLKKRSRRMQEEVTTQF